jgi:Flp pilus assembly CpaE family ATPase
VLIVSQLTVPHLRNATRIYEHLLKRGAIEDRIDLVLNRCNANFERIRPDEVEKHFGRPVLSIIPNDYKALGASRDLGRPVMSDAPQSPARLAIKRLARELAGQEAIDRARRGWRRGLFAWFRGRKLAAGQVH